MEEIFKELENEGYEVKVGWKGKVRKKIMSKAMKKIKEIGDEKKIKYVKTLARYYSIFHNIGYILNPEITLEEDKFELNYLCQYLDVFIDSAKLIIVGVIKAIVDDEPLDSFCKSLMFTHMYTPEQVKEIGHEEIYRRNKKFEEELGLV